MADGLTHDDRMFLESEAVYAQIQQGAHPDVEAALMDAQLRASQED